MLMAGGLHASGQQVMHYVPFYICKSIPSTLMLKGQALMVDAHKMHKRCLKIVNMHRIPDDIVSKFISFPIREP